MCFRPQRRNLRLPAELFDRKADVPSSLAWLKVQQGNMKGCISRSCCVVMVLNMGVSGAAKLRKARSTTGVSSHQGAAGVLLWAGVNLER